MPAPGIWGERRAREPRSGEHPPVGGILSSGSGSAPFRLRSGPCDQRCYAAAHHDRRCCRWPRSGCRSSLWRAILLFFLEVARLSRPAWDEPSAGPVAAPGGARGQQPGHHHRRRGGRGAAVSATCASRPSCSGWRGGATPRRTIASFVAHVVPGALGPLHAERGLAAGHRRVLAAAAALPHARAGILVAPLGLAFLLGTWFLGKRGRSQAVAGVHRAARDGQPVGVALFLLAAGGAALLAAGEAHQEQADHAGKLPPLQALDHAVHRFLIAGFPGYAGDHTGTFWARHLETGTPDEVMASVRYATWLLFAEY